MLFQTGTPLFKQIPGTEYAWHEVVVTIGPNGNYKAVQEKLMAVVDEVYSKYRDEIERQHAAVERRVDILVDVPRPEARLQFAEGGLELMVRIRWKSGARPTRTKKRRASAGFDCERQDFEGGGIGHP
jgi:hypothetical protein